MGSVAQNLLRIFRGGPPANGSAPVRARGEQRFQRHSSGLGAFLGALDGREGLHVLDLGPTSPANITRFADFGNKVYNEDVLLASTDPALMITDPDGNPTMDVNAFLGESLLFNGTRFDAVLCWDIADYIHESLVRPMVARLHSVLNPGGLLLAYFHTRDLGPEAPHFHYHIVGKDTLDLVSGRSFRQQRVFHNRHIENLFRDFSSVKFFLARDNIREVVIVR